MKVQGRLSCMQLAESFWAKFAALWVSFALYTSTAWLLLYLVSLCSAGWLISLYRGSLVSSTDVLEVLWPLCDGGVIQEGQRRTLLTIMEKVTVWFVYYILCILQLKLHQCSNQGGLGG